MSLVASTTTPFVERITFTDPEFKDALEVRNEVFVKEQGCSAEGEQDEFDTGATHWVVYASIGSTGSSTTHNRTPVGTIRLIPPAVSKHSYVTIGRLAVLKPFRGLGISKLLMDESLTYAATQGEVFDVPESGIGWDGRALVHAQKSVEKYYEKMGFEADESMGEWYEEGIVHIGMWKNVRSKYLRCLFPEDDTLSDMVETNILCS